MPVINNRKPKTEQLSVRLPSDLLNRLRVEAHNSGVPLGVLVTKFCEEGLERKNTPPTDLSSLVKRIETLEELVIRKAS